MTNHRLFSSVMLSMGSLLVGACASQHAATNSSLDDRYFEREAQSYQKLQHEGRVIYCQNDPRAATLVPYKGCITETALRLRVENARRSRNTVPPYTG